MAELLALIHAEREGAGAGSPQRGPGAAPLFLGDKQSKLGTNKQENISSDDLSRAAPADLIATRDDKHEVDKTPVNVREAGTVGNTGAGGEQVWKESLSPEERAVLKRYFK
ncbi:MAG: hypothetical protein ACR2OZ_10805 [Verrucomicrobiales bacterium]